MVGFFGVDFVGVGGVVSISGGISLSFEVVGERFLFVSLGVLSSRFLFRDVIISSFSFFFSGGCMYFFL